MAKAARTQRAGRTEAASYLAKAQEFSDAAEAALSDKRYIAATTLAVHAGISAADAICAARLGRRSSAQDHQQAVALLQGAGREGKEAGRDLSRLLGLKPKAEYDPDDIAPGVAKRAVTWASRMTDQAQRIVGQVLG